MHAIIGSLIALAIYSVLYIGTLRVILRRTPR